jgi:predicted nucleotidyltransferase
VIEAPDLRPLVNELVAEGARVVWLAGSFARRDAGPYSDLDIGALTEGTKRGRSYRLYDGRLASIVWTTAAATRASFRDPAQVGGAIPGWRQAVLLHDTDEIGNALQKEANAWDWTALSESCDRWVAAQFMQLSEEVHKLLNALVAGHDTNIAIRRNLLAYRLPLVLAVHSRILYDSETRLWDAVSDVLGAGWRAHQRDALALDGQSAEQSVFGALNMFSLGAAEVRSVLQQRELAVVARTCDLIKATTA